MRIVAFTTEASPVQRILTHIGEPAEPPPIVRARGPPVWDDGLDSLPDWDAMAQQEPEYMFNQEVALVAPPPQALQVARESLHACRSRCRNQGPLQARRWSGRPISPHTAQICHYLAPTQTPLLEPSLDGSAAHISTLMGSNLLSLIPRTAPCSPACSLRREQSQLVAAPTSCVAFRPVRRRCGPPATSRGRQPGPGWPHG